MRHDYDLPGDWDSLSDKEKSDWMTQERCRRQAKSQATATRKQIKDDKFRAERRLQARGYVDVRGER